MLIFNIVRLNMEFNSKTILFGLRTFLFHKEVTRVCPGNTGLLKRVLIDLRCAAWLLVNSMIRGR
jgi:hypothetical protein